jgi:hypothetical protein
MADSKNVTDKQVEQNRAKLDKLNQQIAEEKLKLAQKESSSENVVRQSVIENEQERLEAELEALKQANKNADSVIEKQVESIKADEPVLQEPADVADVKEGSK